MVSTIVQKRADHLKKLGVPTTWRPSEPCFFQREREKNTETEKCDPPSHWYASVRIKHTYHKLWLTTVVDSWFSLPIFHLIKCSFNAVNATFLVLRVFFGLPLCTSFLHIFSKLLGYFYMDYTAFVECVQLRVYLLFFLVCFRLLFTTYYHFLLASGFPVFFRCLLCCSVLVLRAFSFCHNAGWPMGVVQVAISGSYQ